MDVVQEPPEGRADVLVRERPRRKLLERSHECRPAHQLLGRFVRAPFLLRAELRVHDLEVRLGEGLCGNHNFTARSTRRLLDGVAMPVPHRSTDAHRREMT